MEMEYQYMVMVKPLEETGYDPAFFRFSGKELSEHSFTYYTFNTVPAPAFANYWNLVGLRSRNGQEPIFDIQLLFITDEELSLKTYHPEQDAWTYLSIQPPELTAIIHWLETILGQGVTEKVQTTPHFHMLSAEELADLHFENLDITIRLGNVYSYVPSEQIQTENTDDLLYLLLLPRWQPQKKNNQTSVFELKSFNRHLLNDPAFWPEDVQGLTAVSFDQEALEELIFLLKQRVHELD